MEGSVTRLHPPLSERIEAAKVLAERLRELAGELMLEAVTIGGEPAVDAIQELSKAQTWAGYLRDEFKDAAATALKAETAGQEEVPGA